jgi:hypothetical protein
MVTFVRPGSPPAKKQAAKKAAPAKKAAAPRRPVYDDDDDDDAPPPNRAARRAAATNGDDDDDDDTPVSRETYVKGGWGEAHQIATSSEFANKLKLKDGEEEVIRFLEDQPYASLRVHWVQRKGKRAYPCIGDPKEVDTAKNGCPFCAYNMAYQKESRFNIAVLSEEEPIVMSLDVSPKTLKKIEGHHGSKHGPLNRKFYFFRRTGTGFETEYSFDYVRTPSEISEDYPKLYVPSEDELAAMKRFTPEFANKEFASKAEMRKVAKEIVTGEDEDE